LIIISITFADSTVCVEHFFISKLHSVIGRCSNCFFTVQLILNPIFSISFCGFVVQHDCFVVRTYNPFHDSQPTFVNELPLKLARKCLDVFGAASFDVTESNQSSGKFNFCNILEVCSNWTEC
jgi:hypothetical protein